MIYITATFKHSLLVPCTRKEASSLSCLKSSTNAHNRVSRRNVSEHFRCNTLHLFQPVVVLRFVRQALLGRVSLQELSVVLYHEYLKNGANPHLSFYRMPSFAFSVAVPVSCCSTWHFQTGASLLEAKYKCVQNHRITQYPELEGTTEDHQFQPLTPPRAT